MTSQRERGQIMAIFGLSIVALLALTGVVLDGGNIYVQRRTAQNAADAAALAGTNALVQALTSPDSTIGPAICTYVQANKFGIAPTATAYFVGVDGVTNEGAITVPGDAGCTQAASNVIPNGVVAGVHVDVNIPFHTFVAGIVGITYVTASAGATAQVGQISGQAAADAPVAGCGVMMDGNGDPSIFVGGGANPPIDYSTWLGYTFILQSSQLWKHSTHPPCPIYNSGNGDWKGTLQGSGNIGLGTNVPTSPGNSSANLGGACTAAGQPDPSVGTCYLSIPISDGSNPAGTAHIVAFACMQIIGIGNGTDVWSGTLVTPRHCGPSSIYSYSYNWTWAPGSYTFARVALTH